jgi:1-acyl-sn-glycerol-3-phosphate acyltransferase
MKPVFGAAWRIRAEGLEHLPDGPAILCANHVSVLDSFFIPAVLGRRITFVGKAEYLDSWKTRHLFPALGMIPIDRSGGDAAAAALDAAAEVLARGELFGIYPEGTRSRDGLLHKGHTGPARLSLRTGVPIVPVGVRGTLEIMPPDARRPRLFKRATISFGAPIHPARFAASSDERSVLRAIIDEVMYEIRELSGQEYIHTYATSSAGTEADPRDARSSVDVLRPRVLEVA